MDAYDLQARHAPVALIVLPALIVWAFFAPLTSDVVESAFGATAVTAIYVLLAAVARGRGLEVQNKLTTQWGGLPTTTMLRHRDDRLNPITKKKYHDALTQLGFTISSTTEEANDPRAADIKLEAAMDEVRRQAKARGARLVQRENIAFGFVRNLLGLKPLAIVVSCLAFGAFATFYFLRPSSTQFTLAEYGLISAMAFHLLGIVFLVTPKLVRQHAEAYARSLFEEIFATNKGP